MTLRARSFAAALVIVGLAVYTESAHAASVAASCSVSLGAYQEVVTLPANAPALLLFDGSQGNSPTVDAVLIQGTTRTELATSTDTHGLWTLALPSPSAAAGTYSVEIATSCAKIAHEQNSVTSLTLTDPVSFPTSVGTLVHVPSNPPTGVDKVRLEPTETMRAFLPAAQLAISVDGAPAGTSQFVNANAPIELAVNTGEACIENGALHREKRTLKVSVEGAIAGLAESPAPASIDVSIDCGAIEWTSGLPAEKDDAPGGPNGTTTSSSSSSDSGGCSAAPVRTHGGGFGLGALAAGGLGLVAMRRRRRHGFASSGP